MTPIAVEDHLGLVYRAVDGARRHLPREDAVQAGVIGLIRAARSPGFDPSRKFSTYATTAIVRAIERERTLRQPRWILTSELATVDEDGEEIDAAQTVADHREPGPARSVELRDQVQSLLAKLHPTERTIVTARYGLDGAPPRSIAIIASEINLSRQRTHALLVRALSKLREAIS